MTHLRIRGICTNPQRNNYLIVCVCKSITISIRFHNLMSFNSVEDELKILPTISMLP